MKGLIKAFALIAIIVTTAGAQTNPLNMTTMQVVKDMGLGINLGNTFESTGDWINSNGGVKAYETAWGSPEITKDMINGYVSSGFKTVRIPVAWSNLMTGDSRGGTYTISTELLNRIDQVVGYVLDNNMYAIVNIHWDGGWWEKFPTDSAECMRKYKRVWEQLSSKFKDRSGYLVFESLNEEGVWNDIWNRWSGSTGADKNRAYNMLNTINQEFTNLVRTSGGNNATRHLLIAGYATDINLTCDAAFKVPTDAQNRRAVSVHYYDPFGFTHDYGTIRSTWGTTADQTELNSYMDKLKTTFVDKGIPVIVGEYGVAVDSKTSSEIRNYTLAVASAIYTRNMCPVLWDVQLASDETTYYYDRYNRSFSDQQLVTGFKNIVPATPSSSSRAVSSSSRAVSSSSRAVSSSSRAVSSSSRAVSSSSRAVSSSSRAVSSSSRAVSSSSRASSSSAAVVPVVLPRTSYSNTLSAMQNAVNLQITGDAVIQIFNIKGNVVRILNYAEGNYVIPLGDLPTGLYIARASNASWQKTVKVNVVGE
jgi:endoglucanase